MKIPYSFVVVRYAHDILSEEFVNIGIILYAPERFTVLFQYTRSLSRVKCLFAEAKSTYIRQSMGLLQKKIHDVNMSLRSLFHQEAPSSIEMILQQLQLTHDDSIQVSAPRYGMAVDPNEALEYHFRLYVAAHSRQNSQRRRTDDEVWSPYGQKFREKGILPRLVSRTFVASTYEYSFSHTYMNGQWNACEPVSLDLANADEISDKATKWLGRATCLQDTTEPLKIIFLVGPPSQERLLDPYHRALDILDKCPLSHEIVQESESEIEKFVQHVVMVIQAKDEQYEK